MLVSIAPAVAALSLAGLAAAAGALVFWRGRRFIRSRQEYACREIIGDSAARWEKIAAAAVPKLKELQELSGEIIAVGETAGWRLTTEAPPQHGIGGLSRYLGSDDDTLRLNYLSAAARYFAGHPGQRWRDDTALIRLALDAAQRDLRKGKAAFPDAAACYWEALAAGWMPRICYTVAWWTGGGSARGRWSEDATGAQQPACCRCWLISASLLSCRTRGCMACFWPLRPRCCWSACAPSSAAAFSSANIRRRYRQAVVADRGSRPCDNSRGAGWRGVVITLIVHRFSCC